MVKTIESWVREYIIKREVKKMFKSLQGKKTYLVAAAFALLAFLEHMGYIDSKLAMELVTFLNGAGFAALKASKK